MWIDHMVQASPGFSYIRVAYTGGIRGMVLIIPWWVLEMGMVS